MRTWVLAGLLVVLGCSRGETQPPPPSPQPNVQPASVTVVLPPGFPPGGALAWRRTLLQEVSFYWGIAQDPAVFFGQVHQESRWVTTAKSPYAAGIAQFTPATAEWIQGLYAADLKPLCGQNGCPYDARWGLRALVLYDKRLYQQSSFAAGTRDQFAFALAGYNGGWGWIPKERVVAKREGLEDTRWFGNVERTCLRAKQFCHENRHYPAVILDRWAPLYHRWLRL